MRRIGIAAALGLALSLPPLEPWFEATMRRHLLLLLPALLLLGGWAGYAPGRRAGVGPRTLAELAFGLGAIGFWMIPRSLDAAVSLPGVDHLLHLSIFAAGAALARSVPSLPFALQMTLGVNAIAMLGAMGVVYRSVPWLVCATYDLGQQRLVGAALLRLAPVLWVALWAWALLRLNGARVSSRLASERLATP